MIAHFPLLTLLVFWVLVHAVTEWAWRVGRRRGAARDERVSVEPATALLAVLGLLLAFSVSMAVERYDAREQLVIEEANAIGSAELRSHFLADSARTRSRALFEHYLDRRLRWGAGAGDEATQERLLREAGDDQNHLWQIAVESGTSSPTPVFALYESGLDQMIDVAARRAHVRSNRIPAPVLWLLIAITLLANGLFAAVLGHNKKRDTLDLHLLAFATWLVVALVTDLDGPRHGFVQVSQEPLHRLQQAWETASSNAPRDTTLASAARFVDTFYSWYLPLAERGTGQTIALHDSSARFDPRLVTALRRDAEAQARNPNEIVGLDGDPFLDAQDFCQSYEVGSVRYSGASVLVDVHGTCSGQRHPEPDVVAEVRRGTATAWVFVNFQYPGRHSDLLKDLDQLRRDRGGS